MMVAMAAQEWCAVALRRATFQQHHVPFPAAFVITLTRTMKPAWRLFSRNLTPHPWMGAIFEGRPN
jgi:hypothetical protein